MSLSKVVAAAAIAGMLALGILTFDFFRAGPPPPRTRVTDASTGLPVRIEHPPPVEPSREDRSPSARTIVVENGSLSLKLRDQPLGSVLVEISRKSGVSIYSAPSIDGLPATIEFSNLPLLRGLQTLLHRFDVFVYESDGQLRSAWVYERGAGAQLVPVPPESWASTADVERQMHSGSAADRISAIETLVGRNGPGSLEVVNRALLDEDGEVRLRALDVALSAGVNVSRETLTSLTYDSSAAVRMLALQAIVSGTAPGDPRESETEQLIRRSMGDPDADVRAKASELLDGRRSGN